MQNLKYNNETVIYNFLHSLSNTHTRHQFSTANCVPSDRREYCHTIVSATGNFEAEWTKEGGTIMNATLDSKYGLILENVPVTVSGTV